MIVLILVQEYPPYLVGGTATHVQQLARGLVKAGHVVHVCSYSTEDTFTNNDHGVLVHFLGFPLSGRRDQFDGQLHELERLNRMLADFAQAVFHAGQGPDLIHAHEWVVFGCATQLRERFHVPVVLTNHGVWAWLLENMIPHPEAAQIVERERQSCRYADRIIAVSQSLKKEIVERYNVSESAVDVVFNGFDFTPFEARPTSDADTEYDHFHLRECDLIVYAGRLSPQKGVSALLSSAIQVLRQRDNVRYLIAGRLVAGSYSDSLVSMVTHHPRLRDKVLFLDKIPRERLALLYQFAKLAVVPSIYEPFGYAAVEPMAAGKPVVATSTGGLAEIIEHERSGLLVPLVRIGKHGAYDVDVRKLCEAQLRILEDPELGRRLGTNGRERVQSHLGLEQMIDGTLNVYRSMYSS